jgi:hypothetical protein
MFGAPCCALFVLLQRFSSKLLVEALPSLALKVYHLRRRSPSTTQPIAARPKVAGSGMPVEPGDGNGITHVD